MSVHGYDFAGTGFQVQVQVRCRSRCGSLGQRLRVLRRNGDETNRYRQQQQQQEQQQEEEYARYERRCDTMTVSTCLSLRSPRHSFNCDGADDNDAVAIDNGIAAAAAAAAADDDDDDVGDSDDDNDAAMGINQVVTHP